MVNYLVCIDGSEHSKASFYTAINMMNHEKDHLYLLSVANDVTYPLSFWDWSGEEAQLAADIAKRNAKLLVHKYHELCQKSNIQSTPLIAISSHVGEAICQVVKEKKIDFLVLARRGMSKVKRLFIGSVTTYCLEHADCNVLILKGDWALPEEHKPALKEIIKMEEEERQRRMKEQESVDPSLKERKHMVEEEFLKKIETLHLNEEKPQQST